MNTNELQVGLIEALPTMTILDDERRSALARVAIVYPSGNTTAVVFDTGVNDDREQLNQRIMDAWANQSPGEPAIEQCCFITEPQDPDAIGRVEMFGGEFCANAARAALWLLTEGRNQVGLVEVSGANQPLIYRVRNGEVSIDMPVPQQPTGRLERLPIVRRSEGSLVYFEGIAQLVVINPVVNFSPRQQLHLLLAENKYKLAEQAAVGVSTYDESSKKASFCVWVKEVDTMFDETACGSGTAAIAAALATSQTGLTSLVVMQPSGETISAQASYGPEGVNNIKIVGTVTVLYDGELLLP